MNPGPILPDRLMNREAEGNHALQQKMISGKVTDSSGAPLPGVTITITGTTTGTITDATGNYTLPNIPENATLVFSFVGMKTQEAQVGKRTSMNIQMAEETIGLEEIVAIGYGTMKKSDLTGSVTRIPVNEKMLQANVNIAQTFSGVAGLNVQANGGANSDPTFSIRGQNSLSADDTPLIVVDGIIYNGSLSNMNINDVESVDVLKDASAAAVYGSRSANGVLIITTKKGKSQKPVVSFDMYVGCQDMTNNPMRVMNAEEFAVRQVDHDWEEEVYA
jgi:TonB-dependent SusC/RagA subfamily outer membrane receptor